MKIWGFLMLLLPQGQTHLLPEQETVNEIYDHSDLGQEPTTTDATTSTPASITTTVIPAETCTDGSNWFADDGCNRCTCIGGNVACTIMACPPIAEPCTEGSEWLTDNGCNHCNCIKGVAACTLMACPRSGLCGAIFTMPYGQIKSSNYPREHLNNCPWTISAPTGTKIVLSFKTFDLKRNHDFLEIRDGDSGSSPLIEQLDGKHWADIISLGNQLYLKFTSDSYVSKPSFYISWEFQISIPFSVVRNFSPRLRFDSKFGTNNKCFPSSASDYYNERQSNNWKRICNTDYNTIKDGRVPTYWRAMECGSNLHIAYWFFSGYQDTCFAGKGSHNADWEHIVVKVNNYKCSNPSLGAVMFYQHHGWYTKKPGRYLETVHSTHPIVYSGKNSHGSYHDDGGSGGCCYFEDFRKPGRRNQYMDTWNNLEELRRKESNPEFMKDMSSKEKFEMSSPLERSETYEMCSLKGCKGTRYQTCHTSGCAKSVIGDNEIF